MTSKRFLSATNEDIASGRTTDIYFERTLEVIQAGGKTKERSLAEFTVGALPCDWPWGVLCGVEEVVRLLEGRPIDLWGLPEGTVFQPKTTNGVRLPVLTIEGAYADYCLMETPALGLICQSSGVATTAARTKIAAGEKTVVAFGVRRMHPSICPMLDRSAFIGGCDGVSSILGAETIGIEPQGTMPHALIVMFGDQAAAFKAFDEVVDPSVPRVALVDTYSDEKEEAVIACETIKDLYAVRLDTPPSRRGSFADLIREVRWELDVRGFEKVKIFVSGGLDEKAIPELSAAGADGFGVGTSISNAPTIDFAMDIVEKDGKPVAKRGKFSRRKHVYGCPNCLGYEVSLDFGEMRCTRCGGPMPIAEVKLLENGVRAYDEEKATTIRQRVLEQLKRIGL